MVNNEAHCEVTFSTGHTSYQRGVNPLMIHEHDSCHIRASTPYLLAYKRYWIKIHKLKDETHQVRMCAYLFAMQVFRSRDRVSSQYMQVLIGFNRLNFDCGTCTDYWRTFRGHQAKPVFAIAFGENSAIDGRFYLTHCNVAERVTNWEDLGSADALRH